ncbi:MAG: basic amino acid/polyamine antiporter, family [Desulfomicrobiaceae bacterium]|jgi:APA family basic amino acid/polyamine antiporter|nr:basic amino acid/polyamine antiporter, family [Desulfomicrobiaceae bacterium]MDK2874005.1 basic amino acid/polyamine antiporter, family [Desulfomicrobiaceae bacterium]
MEQTLQKKFGLCTAIAMVVGIVIGSGVFFKAEKILVATGGDLLLGIYAWLLGGAIMISCAATFAVMATKYARVNGIVDYAEAALGRTYGYYVGLFMALIYYPTLTSVLAWVSARYTAVLFGWDITGGACMTLSAMYLVGSYALNALSPVLAGRFQVSTTIIKLIPLALMAVVGTIYGLNTGMLAFNFENVVHEVDFWHGLFVAVVATSFAYEGWIIATSINAELKNAKRNLPIALMLGTFIVMLVYILYYVGLAGTIASETLMAGAQEGVRTAFSVIFSQRAGTVLFVFIIISCLGTLNGLMLGCTRGVYSVAVRSSSKVTPMFRQIDPITNMPVNSATFGLLLCGVWLVFFYGANLTTPWFGFFCFDSSELPIVTLYAMYIPIFLMFMRNETALSWGKRFALPVLAIVGSAFMIYAAYFSHGSAVFAYLIIFAVVLALGRMLLGPSVELEAA